jgi:hypothetical protein
MIPKENLKDAREGFEGILKALEDVDDLAGFNLLMALLQRFATYKKAEYKLTMELLK